MKKIVSICLLLALLLTLPVTVFAATPQVKFTSSSSFQVGGTATVDVFATCASVMDSNCTSDMYNAALEQNISVMWRCSNGPDKSGSPITWTAADAGKEYVCRVSFYADSAKTEFVDYIDSNAFTVTGNGGGSTVFKILTNSLPDATVGEYYSVRLQTNEVDPKFSLDRYSQLSEFGLALSEDGVISGRPTKAGNCHVNIIAEGQGGEDYANLDITVSDQEYAPYLELLEEPDQTLYMVGDTFDPTGMEVMIHTFDGSTLLSKNGQYLEYYKQPLQNVGDVKIKISNGELFTFVYITVVPASSAGGDGDMPPAITTKSLPTAYVGKAYSVKIECGDNGAQFVEYYNPGKPNDLSKTGLTLSGKGVLSGTPAKVGSYTFTVCAANDNGEDYATYTLVVKAAEEMPTDPTVDPTIDPTVDPTIDPTADPTVDPTIDPTLTPPDATGNGNAAATDPTGVPTTGNAPSADASDNSADDNTTWIIVAIVLAVLLAGVVVAIILILKSKKKQ